MSVQIKVYFECTVCLNRFTSERAFDKHRAGLYSEYRRWCLSEDEMLAKGMTKNKRGLWTREGMKLSALLHFRQCTQTPLARESGYNPTPDTDKGIFCSNVPAKRGIVE